MNILTTTGWEDYQLLDTGDGIRLEQWGQYRLVRPDPQIIWKSSLNQKEWNKADAVFEKITTDKGKWIKKTSIPDKWLLHYKDLSFWAKLTPFKHTGIFPEQILQWEWLEEKIIKAGREVNILNLFAYTGIASLVAANAGTKVTHVDASKPAIGWARENQAASKLENKPIRWILDDTLKFVQREVKRGVKYDGIIMDPPIYGHGPKGEKWAFNQSFPQLLSLCRQILSFQPLFILVNAYAISSSALMLGNVLVDYTKDLGGQIEVGELVLQEKSGGRLLSTGIYGRWEKL